MRVTAGLAWLVAGTAAAPVLAADVLTQHNDNSRAGANTAETTLTTKNVAPATFGKLWTLYTDGQVVAQPLYVSKLAIDTSTNQSPNAPPVATKGTFNVVVVATMHNTIYAYDADNQNATPNGQNKPLWATWLGQPRPGSKDAIDMWSTNDPEWGILSTPVIDAQKTTLWVAAWHTENGVFRYRLHALDLRSGAERIPQGVVIGGPPLNQQNQCVHAGGYNSCSQKQRSALLLLDGVVYVAFGGDGSSGTVFAFDAVTLAQRALWSSTPNGRSGGIWQSGQGPAADADGNIFLMTGNGTFDAGKLNFGDSFVRLRLDGGALTVQDYFTPCDQAYLDAHDMDLGSGGAALLPGTSFVYGGGKEGIIYLLSRTNLGKYVAGNAGGTNCQNPNVVQAFQATQLHAHGPVPMYGHIHSAPVFWKGPDRSRIYVWGENDHLRAYPFARGKFVTTNPAESIFVPPMGMPGGMLSISSNGSRAGTGIVWAVVPLDGDANVFRGVQGVVLAVDAQDVSRQLWTSELAGARDRLGLFAKYAPPTIAGGKVFVATYGSQEMQRSYGGNDRPAQFPPQYYVAVYGLLPAHPPHPKPIVNQDLDDVTVTRATATAPLVIDTRTCAAATPGNVDCTAALAAKAGAPALHGVIVPVGYTFAGCNLLLVTTASKQAALTDSTGIGWYASDVLPGSQSMSNGAFVPTGALKQIGTAPFKGGAPAVLNQFAGVANCTVGQGAFSKLFKPYMQFENSPDGNIYRNWDRAPNSAVSRTAPSFDRSGDVIGP